MLGACLFGLRKELPRCLDVYISRWALVLITGTDGSCLKPFVSCNDSIASVIICSTEPILHSQSHSPADSLIHCCSLARLTSDWTCITCLNDIQNYLRQWLPLDSWVELYSFTWENSHHFLLIIFQKAVFFLQLLTSHIISCGICQYVKNLISSGGGL